MSRSLGLTRFTTPRDLDSPLVMSRGRDHPSKVEPRPRDDRTETRVLDRESRADHLGGAEGHLRTCLRGTGILCAGQNTMFR